MDADLLAHEEHLKYRYAQFVQTKAALEQAEGSLENFAKVLHAATAFTHPPQSNHAGQQ